MANKLNRSSKIFILVLLLLGLGIAVAYVVLRYFRSDSYAEQIDRIVRTRDSVVTSVYFIRVADYDSLNVRDITADFIRKSLDSNELDVSKTRQYMFHMFTTADTMNLTQDMLDELAYTNPAIEEPSKILRCVKNGWIVSYKFAPYRTQPRSFDMVRTYFYMPRNGIKLKDIEL
jgi:hypothetical protein